jgi:SAM-dependent methyltransferase
MRCAVCKANAAQRYRNVDGVGYLRCGACGSLFADPDFLVAGTVVYADDYWRNELHAARERCFGPAVLRVAETIAYCRLPIRAFVDIGAGTGWLLDALETLLPEVIDRFHAVEPYPPPPPHRTSNANYVVGTLDSVDRTFDAGVCIEVIEHLTPTILRNLVAQLAAVSRPGSLYLFNSGQPDFVEREDLAYLDPHGRGHIVSYSLAGAASIFGPAGFNVITLPGRAWAFLAEFGPQHPVDSEALIARLWHPVPENVSMLQSARFGELIRAAGIEAARAYLPGR